MKAVCATDCRKGKLYVLYLGEVEYEVSDDVTDCIDTYYRLEEKGVITPENDNDIYIINMTDNLLVYDW